MFYNDESQDIRNYLSKVFDNTACARDGTLESGDELVGVNGVMVKGKSKVEVAKMIQASKVSGSNPKPQVYATKQILFLIRRTW